MDTPNNVQTGQITFIFYKPPFFLNFHVVLVDVFDIKVFLIKYGTGEVHVVYSESAWHLPSLSIICLYKKTLTFDRLIVYISEYSYIKH